MTRNRSQRRNPQGRLSPITPTPAPSTLTSPTAKLFTPRNSPARQTSNPVRWRIIYQPQQVPSKTPLHLCLKPHTTLRNPSQRLYMWLYQGLLYRLLQQSVKGYRDHLAWARLLLNTQEAVINMWASHWQNLGTLQQHTLDRSLRISQGNIFWSHPLPRRMMVSTY